MSYSGVSNCICCCVDVVDAGLTDGVTDAGLCALAKAGCGENLTSLTLEGEGLCLLL